MALLVPPDRARDEGYVRSDARVSKDMGSSRTDRAWATDVVGVRSDVEVYEACDLYDLSPRA